MACSLNLFLLWRTMTFVRFITDSSCDMACARTTNCGPENAAFFESFTRLNTRASRSSHFESTINQLLTIEKQLLTLELSANEHAKILGGRTEQDEFG